MIFNVSGSQMNIVTKRSPAINKLLYKVKKERPVVEVVVKGYE